MSEAWIVVITTPARLDTTGNSPLPYFVSRSFVDAISGVDASQEGSR